MSETRVLRFEPAGEELAHFREHDPVLAEMVAAIGPYELELQADRFLSLGHAIVGQQLSMAAARTIWGRFVELVGEVTPERILGFDTDAMRAIGLSNAKARYMHGLAADVLDGTVDLDSLDALDDEAVIAHLLRIKGVGRWTAEMFLIFSLGRPDVFSAGDVGLQRAVGRLYGLADAGPAEYTAVAEPWAPYRSAASLYLWESLRAG